MTDPSAHDHPAMTIPKAAGRAAVPIASATPTRVMLDQFMEVLTTCTAATVAHGGTTTHHHAVGRFHRPFYDKQRPELFARALRGAKRELDRNGMLNPGVLIDP